MIPSKYISTFLPIHELDEAVPTERNGIVEIQPDDLFLMSQMSAYATKTSNAVAVSKKINYGNLSKKISSDFQISGLNNGISALSNNLSCLSIYTVNNISSLSDSIKLSVHELSVHTNTICANLSTTIDENFIRNYTQTCCLITSTGDLNNPTLFAKDIELSNGQLTVNSHEPISNLIVPKDWKLAFAGIASDKLSETLKNLNNVNSFEHVVLSDCYLNCCISALEDDSYGPIDVWVQSTINNSTTSSLYQTLNNPGGFSGTNFFNYYHFAIPLKAFPANEDSKKTKVIVKYRNTANKFKIVGSLSSQYVISEYCFYAVPSKDDLCAFVKKSDSNVQPDSTKRVRKIAVNESGLVTSYENVYYGLATENDAGLIKLGNFTQPNYSVKLSADKAYVTMPSASLTEYGTIKLNYRSSDHSHNYTESGNFLACGLEATSAGNGITYIPHATSNFTGTIKLGRNGSSSFEDSFDGEFYHAMISAENDATGYAQIPVATNDRYGVIKTGSPDTTRIRVVRNVYVDNDGYAKVNVVTPLGVGLFDNGRNDCGYDYDVALDLNQASSQHINVSTFDGNSYSFDQYGQYTFSTTQDINGFYMAFLVYEGISRQLDNNAYMQIICDGLASTVIHPSAVMTSNGKRFQYSTYLGLFPENDSPQRTFAVISNLSSFENDKVHFLIKCGNMN